MTGFREASRVLLWIAPRLPRWIEFRSHDRSRADGAVSLLGNMGVMITLVSGAHVSPVFANLVAIALWGLLNYCLAETFVFRKE